MTKYLATLVLQHAANKLEAYELVATAAGNSVVNEGTRAPRVPLSDSAWAQIEIPKFGEPPPLAVDVWSLVSLEDAQEKARNLIERIEAVSGHRAILDLEAR